MASNSIESEMAPSPRKIDVDVIIVGAGPAGLMAALTLAKYGIPFRIFDKRPGTVPAGQADGLQPRTLEVLQSLNIAQPFIDNGCQMHEVNFWNPDPEYPGKIVRTSTVPDTVTPARYPETTFHQGHLETFFVEAVAKYGYVVERPFAFVDVQPVNDGNAVAVELEDCDGNSFELVSKYVIGCDGAHSQVRKALGFKIIGDQTDHIWGVMDIFVHTNFPDIRMRCKIHSEAGSVLLIPREGELVRVYVQVDKTVTPCSNSRFEKSSVSIEALKGQAKKVMKPYQFDITSVEWFSPYQIGQRVSEAFSKYGRVFIAGDACHTHSPKSGQGMNISMMDTYNLTWRLALVERGLAKPHLLDNYEFERIAIAQYLIDFDRRFSAYFTAKAETEASGQADFVKAFTLGNQFTSGAGICYTKSMLTYPPTDYRVDTEAVEPITPGKRLLNIRLTRQIDACPRDLHDDLPSNGRFKVFIYTGDVEPQSCEKFGSLLSSPTSFLNRFAPPSARGVAPIYETVTSPAANKNFTFDCFLIHSLDRHTNPISDFPAPFNNWRWRVFADGKGEAREMWGLHEPAAIIVRPDGYVGIISALGPNFVRTAGEYFDKFLVEC